MRTLFKNCRNGIWENTNLTSWVIIALERYYRVFENITPDLSAHIFAGNEYVDQELFRGREVHQRVVDIALPYLLDNLDPLEKPSERDIKDILLLREGKGRLYYRLHLNFAPSNLSIPPVNRGFVVRRSYHPVQSPNDVIIRDGKWTIQKGSLVKIDLEFESLFTVNLVALVDYMPAGFEAVNNKIAATVSEFEKNLTLSNNSWFVHTNIRDERVEVFANRLPIGNYRFTYYARATTVGSYIAPPAKVEEMYTPDICGNSNSELLIIQ